MIPDKSEAESVEKFIDNIKLGTHTGREHFIFYGASRSGKSFLISQIIKLIPNKVKRCPLDNNYYYDHGIIEAVKADRSNPGILTAPILIIDVTSGYTQIANTIFKEITEGNNVICRRSTKKYRTITPTCNIIYVTNTKPDAKISKLCTCINFPFSMPSHFSNIMSRFDKRGKLFPDLIKLTKNMIY